MASGGDSIKLFKFIQKTYRDIGIYPPEPNQSRSPINSKNCFFLYCLAQFSLTSYAYFWFQANSMIEYGMVFYTCSTTILSIVVYLIQIWQMKKFLNFIENCERFVEKREYSMQFIVYWAVHKIEKKSGSHSKDAYKDVNEKIEQLSKCVTHALILTAAVVMLLPLLCTTISYCFLNAGAKSFVLFFLNWYVHSRCQNELKLK